MSGDLSIISLTAMIPLILLSDPYDPCVNNSTMLASQLCSVLADYCSHTLNSISLKARLLLFSARDLYSHGRLTYSSATTLMVLSVIILAALL
jgi:hypothetical protein